MPVLLVHGLNDTARGLDRMAAAIRRAGAQHVRAVDLSPNDGSVSLVRLAEQVDRAAAELLDSAGGTALDLVAFSMGTVVSRHWLQRMGGRTRVRRFVSISGPHAGTWVAYLRNLPGILEMRPGSAFLRDLESDPDPFGDVEVHVIYTPLDLMILPARSSLLRHARSSRAIPVVLHPLILQSGRVLRAVTDILAAADAPPAG